MKNSKNLRSGSDASTTLRATTWAALAALVFAVVGCGDDSGSSADVGEDDGVMDDSSMDDSSTDDSSTGEDLPEGVYESAHPSGSVDGENNSRGAVDGTGTASGSAGGEYDEGADDAAGYEGEPAVQPDSEDAPDDHSEEPPSAERAIEEADIIKIEGDRLYALSAYGGLSVVDVSDPDDLKLLGRHRATATPFEMYVREGNVFVLYNGYGEYAYDEGDDYWTFYQTSYVVSLDTSDPKDIKEDEKFEIAGYISDSRLIGDSLYVVAYDDSYCYRCGNVAETNVMSLDVSVPDAIEKVDELTFPERQDDYGWRRSLSATDERLYIAGPRYGDGSEPVGSIIQVVDVSRANGKMEEGDSIEVAGQINSRWQMDEYDGVLRVVSQPMWWRSDGIPTVETFQIESSDELVPLAELPMELPSAEQLQAVRFDATRGYAITFERTDPLFTLDLSDPENPVQAGQLEMPGWVYYMEPRGDRVIGLGFDQGNEEGALTVSIFDVSDLSAPTMVDRVNFGGDWASLAEDQDRIHKSFQVLDAHDLILVPFSGWIWNEDQSECRESETFLSGVQLIDWGDDELTLRGIADSQGQARRGFFVGDRLLTMSDERVEAFDIDDRSNPKSTSKVDLAQIVNQLAVAGDSVVRVGNSWWGQTLEATVSTLKDLENFAPGVTVELPGINTYDCNSESYLDSIMSSGERAYFLYDYYDWSQDKQDQMKVLTLDVSDPDKPKIVGDASLGFRPSYGRTYVPGMVDNGVAAVAVGDSLVFAEHDTEYNNLGFIVKSGYTIEVVDFSNPDDPERSTVEMPESIGSTGLVTSGDIVATSHFEISPTNSNAVRFYLDRVDVSDAGKPELMDPVNIPGSLLAYDHETSRALTVDYQYVRIEDISPKQCYEEEFGQFLTDDPSRVDYEDGRGPCQALRYELYLVEIDDDGIAHTVGSYDADKGVQITGAAIGDDRVFLGTGRSGGNGYAYPEEPYYGGDVAISRGGGFYIGYTSYGFESGEAKVLVASGLAGGDLEVASLSVETAGDFYGFSGMIAKGTKAVVSTGWQGRLSVIDASDPSDPVVFDSAELGGYVSDLDLAGNVAIAALGQSGVQTIDLGED